MRKRENLQTVNWYKIAQNKFLGYKIVGKDTKTGVTYSIYNKKPISIQMGVIDKYEGIGTFLGTSKQFCLDYYSCGTEDEDGELLLTYEYDLNNLIKGDPSVNNGEVQVSEATLIDIEEINKEELC